MSTTWCRNSSCKLLSNVHFGFTKPFIAVIERSQSKSVSTHGWQVQLLILVIIVRCTTLPPAYYFTVISHKSPFL